MHIAFGFYGIIYGPGGRTGSDRDFRHCWPNLKQMVIDPILSIGYTADVYFSGYPVEKDILDELKRIVGPKDIFYSDFNGSDPFTAKGKLVNSLVDVEADAIVFTRSDVHWSRIPIDGNVDWDRFNFLFAEKGWWDNWGFTCDNFYIYPKRMAAQVAKAMHDCYAWPRGKPLVDTHGLIHKLQENGINTEEMQFISNEMEISDVNSWYTCCRSGLPEDGRGGYIHPEVKERFGYV